MLEEVCQTVETKENSYWSVYVQDTPFSLATLKIVCRLLICSVIVPLFVSRAKDVAGC